MDINGKRETIDGYIRRNEVSEEKSIDISTVFGSMLRGLCSKQARIYLTKTDFFSKKGCLEPSFAIHKKGGDRMGRKRPSLNHQLWSRLESKKAIGEKRHDAKALARANGTKVETIHSYNTYEAYKQASKRFASWLKEEFPEIKNIKDVDKDIGSLYIRARAESGKSAYTYSQDIAMLNKIFNFGLTKEYCGVANRQLANITNNRSFNGYKTNEGKLEIIFEGTGLRRNELAHLTGENLVFFNNKLVAVNVNKGSKGGRIRTAEVLPEHQEKLYDMLKNVKNDELVFNGKIPKPLQTHRLRGIYCQKMYNSFIEKGMNEKSAKQRLTQNMGHNRISILAHYGVK